MVIVSHRLSSLVDCDQILVMEQGRIVDCGKHAVLVERCAIYRQLWNQQNRHSEAPRPTAAAWRPEEASRRAAASSYIRLA